MSLRARYTYLSIAGWLYPYMILGVDFTLEVYYGSNDRDSRGYLWIKDKKIRESAQLRLSGEIAQELEYVCLLGKSLQETLQSINTFDPSIEDYPGPYKEKTYVIT